MAKGSGSYELIIKTNEPSNTMCQTNCSTSDAPEGELSEAINCVREHVGSHVVSEDEAADELQEGTLRYIAKGFWFSKMVVTFFLNGKENKKEAKGNGKIVKIPSDARHVEVRFQVSRFKLPKYDGFTKTWYRPYKAYVFRYEEPPVRTFTISGSPWRVPVIKVSDEYHQETGEVCEVHSTEEFVSTGEYLNR